MIKNGRIFSLSENYAGSEGMTCQHEDGCTTKTCLVWLSPEEVKRLNTKFPEDIEGGLARGSQASLLISNEKLGEVLCTEHCPEEIPVVITKTLQDLAVILEEAGYEDALSTIVAELVPLARANGISLDEAIKLYSNYDEEQDTSWYQLYRTMCTMKKDLHSRYVKLDIFTSPP